MLDVVPRLNLDQLFTVGTFDVPYVNAFFVGNSVLMATMRFITPEALRDILTALKRNEILDDNTYNVLFAPSTYKLARSAKTSDARRRLLEDSDRLSL